MSGWPETTPHRKEPLPDKPGRYRIDHPDTPMPLDVRAWQMWAVHTSDLDAMGFETREAFFLACLEAAIENLRAENARLRGALADMHAGWRYIRLNYGDLSGVGWERCDAAARAALDPDGQKERRAKALAELAEMDADLLDIDPEMKS